jgi:hypothetical protein
MNLNWRELNEVLPTLDEVAVRRLLDEEREGEQRQTLLLRLHQRYTVLRMTRERMEILRPAPKARALT